MSRWAWAAAWAGAVTISAAALVPRAQWDTDSAAFDCAASAAKAAAASPQEARWGERYPDDAVEEEPARTVIHACMFAKGYRFADPSCGTDPTYWRGLPSCYRRTWRVFVP